MTKKSNETKDKIADQIPVRKTFNGVKIKYSPLKKFVQKHNQVFVKEYKFGLLSLTLKKGISLYQWNVDFVKF